MNRILQYHISFCPLIPLFCTSALALINSYLSTVKASEKPPKLTSKGTKDLHSVEMGDPEVLHALSADPSTANYPFSADDSVAG